MIRRLVQLEHPGAFAAAAARQGWSLELPLVLLVPCGGSDGCGDLEGSFGAARSNSRESSNFSRRLRRASRFFESTGLRGTAAARHLDSTGQFAFCSRARKIQRPRRAQIASALKFDSRSASPLAARRTKQRRSITPSPRARKIQTRAIAAQNTDARHRRATANANAAARRPPSKRCSGSTSTGRRPSRS